MSSEAHWNAIFTDRVDEDLGWYEPEPTTLADVLGVAEPGDAVIDVGSGTSSLVDRLLAEGFDDITLVDVAPAALERTRHRLGSERDDAVTYVVADVADFDDGRRRDLWHDRAVFHFLVDADDRVAYRESLDRSLAPGGAAVVATFAPDGPEQCAGLPVRRYSEGDLASEFAEILECAGCRTARAADDHTDRRPYVICSFRKPEGGDARVRRAA